MLNIIVTKENHAVGAKFLNFSYKNHLKMDIFIAIESFHFHNTLAKILRFFVNKFFQRIEQKFRGEVFQSVDTLDWLEKFSLSIEIFKFREK